MSSFSKNVGISRQILMIVLSIIVLVVIGTSVVSGVTGFNNLATITLKELDRVSVIFAVQIEELQSNAETSLVELESNAALLERLEQLTTLGPYYLDGAEVGQAIEEADKIYSFQSQLGVIQTLFALKNLHGLSSVSLYSVPPYGRLDGGALLNLRIDDNAIHVAQFGQKGFGESRQYFYAARDVFQPPSSDLFNVSAVYQLTVKDFYDELSFQPSAPIAFRDTIIPEQITSNQGLLRAYSRMIESNGRLSLKTWGYLNVPLANPDTWEREKAPAMLLVMEQKLDGLAVGDYKRQLGIDVAIARNSDVLVSSLPQEDVLGELRGDNTTSSLKQEFYYASQDIALNLSQEQGYKAVVLSPISTLAELTGVVFMQLGVLALVAILIAVFAIYWVIRKLVTQPLGRLTHGVKRVSQGDLSHEVPVESQNELGDLAEAFNTMSSELSKKNEELLQNAESLQESNTELKLYQMTLQDMVERRTAKLKETQKQLIESEKMASLGELVAGVAHEINTPVGVGVTAASCLADEVKAISEKYEAGTMTKSEFLGFLETSQQSSEMILSNLVRATELVKSFKQVAVDQTAEDHRSFSIALYIEEVLTTLHPVLKKTSHNISIKGSRSIMVDSYPGVYSQIITNLVMNSIIHAFNVGTDGSILIEIFQDETDTTLVYSDNGRGLDEDSLAKLFDPFYTTRRGSGGTGLGMHVVYNLVTQKLRGKITCESQLNQGIKITLIVPIKDTQD